MTGRVRWRHRIEDWGLRLLALPLGPLGWRGTQRLGAFFGTAGFHLARVRVGVTRANLARAFGGRLSGDEIEGLARATYRQWGMTFLEIARFGAMNSEEVRRLVRIDGSEFLDAVRAEGKGALLLTGHIGNFDLFGAAVAARGYPLSVLVQRQTNPLVEERLRASRERMGERVIARGAGVREILRALRRNEFVAIVGDQDAGGAGIFVDFLGTPASTPRGPAQIAYRSGAPIVFGTIERGKDGRHGARFESPLRANREAPEEEEVLRLTVAVARLLESAVRRRPDHYFWPHRRWKTPPPGGRGAP
ncbi:MAG: lysophospholipid acyltransferase family protein [Candidatus Eisenbacteria bacterium]